MSKTSLLTVRIDPDVKTKLEKLYSSFGLTLSDAINMFIHQSLIVGGLPFELKNPKFVGKFDIEEGTIKEKVVGLSVEEIRKIAVPIAEKYDLRSLYLVGSRARGDYKPDSDYDFCYDLKKPSLSAAAGLMDDLSKIIDAKVDLIDKTMCSDSLLKNIEKDGIIIYEG